MPEIGRNFLGQKVQLTLAVSLLLVASVSAQSRPQVSLETSETLFTVLTAINTCGYDQELSASDPLRAQIRAEVAKAVVDTPAAAAAAAPLCTAYRHHDAG